LVPRASHSLTGFRWSRHSRFHSLRRWTCNVYSLKTVECWNVMNTNDENQVFNWTSPLFSRFGVSLPKFSKLDLIADMLFTLGKTTCFFFFRFTPWLYHWHDPPGQVGASKDIPKPFRAGGSYLSGSMMDMEARWWLAAHGFIYIYNIYICIDYNHRYII
jgi:hypothetical protein